MRNFTRNVLLAVLVLSIVVLIFVGVSNRREVSGTSRVGVDSYMLREMLLASYGSAVSVNMIDAADSTGAFDIVFTSKAVSVWGLLNSSFGVGPKLVSVPYLGNGRWLTIDEWRFVCNFVYKNIESVSGGRLADSTSRDAYLNQLDGLHSQINVRLSQVPSVQQIIVSDGRYLESFAEFYRFRFIDVTRRSQRGPQSVRLAEFLAKNWVSRVFSVEKDPVDMQSLILSGHDIGWDFEVVRLDFSVTEQASYEQLALYLCDLIVGQSAADLELNTIDEYLSSGGGAEF